MTIRLEFKPQDCWVGVYWRSVERGYWIVDTDVWICLVPMLPIHISWSRTREVNYADTR